MKQQILENSFVGDRGRKTGLPPGTPVHVGEKRLDTVKMTVIGYNPDAMTWVDEARIDDLHQLPRKEGQVCWVTVNGLHDIDFLREVATYFGLHDLVLEDIVNTEQRAKIEEYDDYLYLVSKLPQMQEENARLHVEQVSLVLGKDFVLLVLEDEHPIFQDINDRLRNKTSKLRSNGADFLFYTLLDEVVDHFFNILEILGEKIEHLEDHIISDNSPETLRKINRLRHRMILLHRIVMPMREVMSSLERHDSNLLSNELSPYLRDVYDHIVQVIDTVDTYREILSGSLDIHLSANGNRMNAIMKVLTVISTIFMPLTFIVGLYGMNFEHMPELKWRYGYPIVLVLMTVIGLLMVRWFKRKKWF